MNDRPAIFRQNAFTGVAGVAVWFLGIQFASALVADFQLPEGFQHPVPIQLSSESERSAEAHARYMQAIFEEETEGPDKALENKKRVLAIDPGFCELALNVAQHYLRRGETTEAISILKDAAKASPRNPAPSLALASIYLRQLEKPALAEKFATLAQDADPEDSRAYEVLWEIYRTNGQTKRLDALFLKAFKIGSKNPAFWLDLAELRLRGIRQSTEPIPNPEREKILNLVDRAAQCHSSDPEILSRTADCYFACRDAASALELYKTAAEKNAALPGVKEKLALCHSQIGDLSGAAKLLDEVIAANPMNLAAYDQAARIRIQQNDPTAALALMRQALIIAPIDPRRYEDIIRTALRAGDANTAVNYSNEALKRFPFLNGFSFLQAVSLSQAKQHAAALMAFERTLVEASNSHPEMLDAAFFMSYGAAAEQAGHTVKAAELIKTAMRLDSGNPEPYNFLAYMWADRGENLEEAESLIRQALEMDPQNGAYIDTLGWVYFHQGRYNEAIGELLRAASLLEKPDPVVLEHIGDAYEKLGKTADALGYWQKAEALDEKNPKLVEKIDRYSPKVVKQPQEKP